MSDPDSPDRVNETDADRQPPRLSPEEIERLEDYEELEDFIEGPPEGELSIISDEDVPGAPG
jgi:hypothetical protein